MQNGQTVELNEKKKEGVGGEWGDGGVGLGLWYFQTRCQIADFTKNGTSFHNLPPCKNKMAVTIDRLTC